MPEAVRSIAANKSPRRQGLAPVIPMPEQNSPQAIATFATNLRSLSNYEVWKRVQSGILSHPSQDKAEADSWRFRMLLDELQWRHSGIEGAGSVPDLDHTIAEAHEVH
jgi:hypothetical protein